MKALIDEVSTSGVNIPMKKITLALGLLGLATTVHAAAPEWLDREFTNSWDVPGKGLESFLNEECRPSGLDGLQLVAVQDGHNRPYHLHVYCRQDKSPTAQYRVSMPKATRGGAFALIKPHVADPNVRIGPFYLGNDDEPNGILMIEKIR